MIIDVFNHFMPKAYLGRLADLVPGHVAVTAFPRLKTLVDVEARLRLLDQFNDLRQVICFANPPLESMKGCNGKVGAVGYCRGSCATSCAAAPRSIAQSPITELTSSITSARRGICIARRVAHGVAGPLGAGGSQ